MTLLDDVVTQMHARADELRPAVEEFERLSEALSKLNGIASDSSNSAVTPSRGPGRPRGSGEWSVKALQSITAKPGQTAIQIANDVGVNDTYIFRVVDQLARDGLAFKAPDKTWHPVNGKGHA